MLYSLFSDTILKDVRDEFPWVLLTSVEHMKVYFAKVSLIKVYIIKYMNSLLGTVVDNHLIKKVTLSLRGVNTQNHTSLWTVPVTNCFTWNCFTFKTRIKSDSQKFDYFVSVNLSNLSTIGIKFLPTYTLSYLWDIPPELYSKEEKIERLKRYLSKRKRVIHSSINNVKSLQSK